MRKRFTGVLTLCLFGAGALAGTSMSPAQESVGTSNPPVEMTVEKDAQRSAEMRLKRLNQQLNLSNQQKSKIRPLLEHEVERIEEVRSNTSLSEGETQKRIHAIHKDTNQRIGQLLTAEQRKQWPDANQQKNANAESGDHPREGGATPVSLPTP